MKPHPPIPPSNPVMHDKPAQTTGSRHGPDDEAAWIRAARAGDAGAFRNLVERHQGSAVNLAFRMLRSRTDAEEVAQDAFVRAWRALPEFRGESRFGTWLHRIVVRRALDRAERLKVRSRREAPLDDSIDRIADPQSDGPDLPELRRRLDAAMEILDERERLAITLYYHEDRSVESVSAVMDLPDGTVKTLLHRARARLRTRLAGKDHGKT